MTFIALDLVSGEQSLTQCCSGGRTESWGGKEGGEHVEGSLFSRGRPQSERECCERQGKRVNREKLD